MKVGSCYDVTGTVVREYRGNRSLSTAARSTVIHCIEEAVEVMDEAAITLPLDDQYETVTKVRVVGVSSLGSFRGCIKCSSKVLYDDGIGECLASSPGRFFSNRTEWEKTAWYTLHGSLCACVEALPRNWVIVYFSNLFVILYRILVRSLSSDPCCNSKDQSLILWRLQNFVKPWLMPCLVFIERVLY